jgi:hypothetical protein
MFGVILVDIYLFIICCCLSRNKVLMIDVSDLSLSTEASLSSINDKIKSLIIAVIYQSLSTYNMNTLWQLRYLATSLKQISIFLRKDSVIYED